MMKRSCSQSASPSPWRLSGRSRDLIDHAERDAEHVDPSLNLFSKCANLARDKGYCQLAYQVCLPLPLSKQRSMLFHQNLGPHASHPSVNLDWRPETPNTHPHATPRPTLPTALPNPPSLNGAEFSIAAEAHHASGASGMLWLEPAGRHETPCQLTIFALAQLIHSLMTEQLLRQHVPESLISITAREQEILRWTADGKTVPEIGQIIDVSERTVKFHLCNVMRKLNANNKTQATVKAAALGLLWL